jgi:hypothetical protein
MVALVDIEEICMLERVEHRLLKAQTLMDMEPGKIKNNSCIAYALGSLGLLRKMVDGRMARFNEFMPSRLVRIVREEIDEALHEIKSARFYKFASSTDIVQCKICLMSARSMMAKYVLPPELQL